jgi:type 1 glutamine amidotransferase
MLLHTEFTGEATGFVNTDWPDNAPRPIYYLRPLGDGEVLYLNLGHCRGHYDMQPMVPFYPNVEMGSWDKPEYYELLRRGIAYCKGD